jgi:hypothetical protein
LCIEEALLKLKEVCVLLQELIHKYDREITIVKRQCRAAIDNKESKHAKLYHMRKIKLIQHHQESARKRLLACTEKQYHLESIKITVLHLEAIKTATDALGHIMKETDVEKVEELQDKLSDLINDAVDIQNIVSQDINEQYDWDDEELEKELSELSEDSSLWPEVSLDQSTHEELHDTDASTPLIHNPTSPPVRQNVRKAELA